MLSHNDLQIKAREIQERTAKLVDFVIESAGREESLHNVERHVFDDLLRIGFEVIDMFVALQGDGDLGETVQTPEGRTLHRSEKPKLRRLRTIFGEHHFQQYVYAAGKGKQIALRPVDARLQLPAGPCSYLLEEFSQLFCVEEAFGLAGGNIETVFGQEMSVDTLERINRQMAEQAEEFFASRPAPPAEEEGELVVMTADAKGVPMVVEESHDLLPFEDPLEKPGNRKMATLGAIYSVDRYVRAPEQVVAALFRDGHEEPLPPRPKPCGKRLMARFTRLNPDDGQAIPGPYPVMSWLCEEARQRDPSGQRPLIRLLDGQESLRDASDVFLDQSQWDRVVDILDIIHVAGRVWKAAHLFHSSKSHQAEKFVRDRLLRILRGQGAGVVSGLRRMGGRCGLTGQKKKDLTTICNYLENNLHRMRYDEYLVAGYPIATGVIEGACRHLVKDRMERSGMRWVPEGAQAMLHVRAVSLNGQWREYQQYRITKEQKSLHPYRCLVPQCPNILVG
jgi:hypothetical protein